MGPLTFGKSEENIFLGREIAQHRDYSEQTAIAIDEEVRGWLPTPTIKAVTLLTENREILENLAQALLEEETLDGDDVEAIVTGKPRVKKNHKSPARHPKRAGQHLTKEGSGRGCRGQYRRRAKPRDRQSPKPNGAGGQAP
jgi:cell division protease FtsH